LRLLSSLQSLSDIPTAQTRRLLDALSPAGAKREGI
jgi:hypothetical protein